VKKSLVIVNRSSGSGFSESELRTVLASVLGASLPTLVYPESRADAINQTYLATAAGVEEIFVWGGDGSLNAVVHGVMSAQTEGYKSPSIRIIGGGSGSDFLRTMRSHPPRANIAVDIGLVEILDTGTRRYFINGLSCGVTAEIAELKNAMPRWIPGSLKYLVATCLRIFRGKLSTATVMNEVNFPEILGVMVLNGQFVGGGMRIMTRSSADDGLLESVLLPKLNVIDMIRAVASTYAGGLEKSLVAKVEPVAVPLKISFATSGRFETDGEIFDARDVVVSSINKALEISYL